MAQRVNEILLTSNHEGQNNTFQHEDKCKYKLLRRQTFQPVERDMIPEHSFMSKKKKFKGSKIPESTTWIVYIAKN